MINIFLFVMSFIFLWKSSDYFVESSHKIAVKLSLPPILIGATVVAFGTSTPELFVSIFAAIKNENSVAYGNLLGSNIANTFLILGVALTFACIQFNSSLRQYMVMNCIGVAGIWLLLFFFEPSRQLALFALLIFFGLQFILLRDSSSVPTAPESEPFFITIIVFSLSLIFLILSSKVLVSSLINMAIFLGISTTFLSLAAVAFGTSLPELVTTISFIKKKHIDILIGNVTGSNIFNLLFVLPITWMVSPLSFPSHFFLEFLILIFISSVLIIYSMLCKKTHAFVGWGLLAFYFVYLGFRFFFPI